MIPASHRRHQHANGTRSNNLFIFVRANQLMERNRMTAATHTSRLAIQRLASDKNKSARNWISRKCPMSVFPMPETPMYASDLLIEANQTEINSCSIGNYNFHYTHAYRAPHFDHLFKCIMHASAHTHTHMYLPARQYDPGMPNVTLSLAPKIRRRAVAAVAEEATTKFQ